MSDAALVKECKAIFHKPTASAAAVKDKLQPSEGGQRKQGSSNSTGPHKPSFDIMDIETQLLQEPLAMIPKAEAQPALAQPSADQMQPHQKLGSPSYPAPSEPDKLTSPHQNQTSRTGTISCNNAHSQPSKPSDMQLGGELQSTCPAAESCDVTQPPVMVSSTVAESRALPAPRTAADHGDSSMNALLQSMLTGNLAPG